MEELFLIPFCIVAAILLALPIIIGVYVYRDAERRGMNALLWALAAALIPSLLGLLVYLLICGKNSALCCPECGSAVEEDTVICPKCGTKLCPVCPGCSATVAKNWKQCPNCGVPLDGVGADVRMPVRTKDGRVWKMLVVVLCIPLLLAAMLAIGYSMLAFKGSARGTMLPTGELDGAGMVRETEDNAPALGSGKDGTNGSDFVCSD